MVDKSLIEEVVKINSLKDNQEIEKYYIDENLNEIDKINHILKKGYSVQKAALIHNIPKLITSRDIAELIFSNIIEYVEIWDESLQIDFAIAISEIFKYVQLHENIKHIYNLIIKFCMKIISTDDKNISDYYIQALNQIVNFFSLNGKIRIENDIIDFTINLGNFGKSVISRRFSVYFCSCILQINDSLNNDIINRFMILSSDTEKLIRLEISYHMMFLCRELEDSYIRKYVLKIVKFIIKQIDNYLNEDDIHIRASIIISILNIIPKINDDNFLTNCSGKINAIMEVENKELVIIQIKIFRGILKEISRFPSNSSKYFNYSIQFFLKKHFINKEKEGNFLHPLNFLYEDAHIIFKYLKGLNEMGLLSDVFSLLVNVVFDKNFKILRDDNGLIYSFFDNIENIMLNTPKQLQCRLLIYKFYFIFEDNLKLQADLILKNLELIFSSQKKIENVRKYIKKDEFFYVFNCNFNKVENYLKNESNCKIISNFLHNLINCEGLYLVEDFINKIYTFIQSHLKTENLQVKTQAIKLLVKILREGSKQLREEILKYTETNILNVKNFYVKRLYFIFFEECLGVFSFTFIKEKKIFENFFRLVQENNIIFLNKFLKTIPKFYHFIHEDSKLKNQVLSKVDTCKKNMGKDILIVENLKMFESWLENFLKNYDVDENRNYLKIDKVRFEKENKLNIIKESVNHHGGKKSSNEIEEMNKKKIPNKNTISIKKVLINQGTSANSTYVKTESSNQTKNNIANNKEVGPNMKKVNIINNVNNKINTNSIPSIINPNSNIINTTNYSTSPNHKLKKEEINKSYKYHSERSEKSFEKNVKFNNEKIDKEKSSERVKNSENSVERNKNIGNGNILVNTKNKVMSSSKYDLYSGKNVNKKTNKFK